MSAAPSMFRAYDAKVSQEKGPWKSGLIPIGHYIHKVFIGNSSSVRTRCIKVKEKFPYSLFQVLPVVGMRYVAFALNLSFTDN